MAKKLGCYVAGGYPERLGENEREEEIIRVTKVTLAIDVLADAESSNDSEQGSSKVKSQPIPVGANSAVIYGPDGEWFGGYRKTHLFDLDKTWAKPGEYMSPAPNRVPEARPRRSGKDKEVTYLYPLS